VISNFNTMQRALQQKDAQLTANNQAKKAMLGGISRDLRTPLTVIKGNIKGVQDGIAATPEKRQQYLATAYQRTLDVEDMLNKLFATFDYETGEVILNKEPTQIADFIAELTKTQKNLTLVNHLTPEATLEIDQIELRRVFDNLINNAIKHNQDQKDLQMTIELSAKSTNLLITFSDNGHGIKPGHEQRIFNEFYKEDSSRNDDKKSHGLGLFIVEQIIKAHGGTITAQNKNPGLQFDIVLPNLIIPAKKVKSKKGLLNAKNH